jgi:oligopeptide/dipeptide ABC transporter ATP-binding protein
VPVEGDVPNPSAPPPGCPFHTRCHFAVPRCREVLPPLAGAADDPDHLVACIRADEIAGLPEPATQ